MAKSLDEIRALLEGPVSSISTPFLADGEIDWDGLANILDRSIQGGSGVALLTYGDSQFEFLSDEEAEKLTRFVVERVAGRALVIAANRRWWTGRNLEFARFCRDLGADVLMTLPSPQMQGAPHADLAAYYLEVAKITPVMLVGAPDHGLLDLLTAEPRICCFKEDGTEEYAVRTMRRYGDRWTFMTGGQLWRHFTQWPFGCRAFMSTWCAIEPEVNRRYWRALLGNDLFAASRVVSAIDAPTFDMMYGFPGGWQPVWRALLEIKGIARRYLRPPMHSATDEELERLQGELGRILKRLNGQ